jgi:hypothetical protein
MPAQCETSPALARVRLPQRPAWLEALVGDATFEPVACDAATGVEIAERGRVAILRASLPVRALDDAAMRAAVGDLYAAIASTLRARALFPWRYWNYLPEIGRTASIGANRYQVFNAGRCDGLRTGYGEVFSDAAPAASAVGHADASLVVDLLAGPAPGVAVDNPRQIPPLRYSQRWGPLPPCFARATLLPAPLPGERERCLLISGTASIVGEDTRHAGDVAAQIHETCANLVALVGALGALRFRELRLYVARERDADRIAAAFAAAFPRLERLEVAVADLCRPELLLEAEGVVILGAGS